MASEEANAASRAWLGVDVGGTFTDVVFFSETGGAVGFKVVTDPENPLRAVLERLRDYADFSEIKEIVHGTTIATNALIERRLAKVALVTTRGFRDVLEIGRQNRTHLYEVVGSVQVPPLVRREDRYEISERVTSSGVVELTPSVTEAPTLMTALEANGYEAIALTFINSIRNDENERSLREEVEYLAPTVISTEVDGQMGEYERTSTAVANATLLPLVKAYLERCVGELTHRKVDASFSVLASNGGFAAPVDVKRRPATLLMSGPAGGAAAAKALTQVFDDDLLVGFDMGGTSTDVFLVQNGNVEIADEILGIDYPVRHPSIAIETIGAGGGSIAWADDETGALRVGPESAGSSPGPVCYGLGGSRPTVCDADLVLGHLPRDVRLANSIDLDMLGAELALSQLGASYGWDARRTAEAINRIVNFRMSEAIRLISVKRGVDVRGATLVAYGGGGPLHAYEIAAELGFKRIIIPAFSSMFSALGCLISDWRLDGVASVDIPVRDFRNDRLRAEVQRVYKRLTEEHTGAAPDDTSASVGVDVSLDLRFASQNNCLNVPLKDSDRLDQAEVDNRFKEEHKRLNGYVSREEVVVSTVRVSLHHGSSLAKPWPLLRRAAIDTSSGPQLVGKESCWFAGREVDTPIYSRPSIPSDFPIIGPAIVIDESSTTVVDPARVAITDEFGNIIMNMEET